MLPSLQNWDLTLLPWDFFFFSRVESESPKEVNSPPPPRPGILIPRNVIFSGSMAGKWASLGRDGWVLNSNWAGFGGMSKQKIEVQDHTVLTLYSTAL